MSIMTAEQQFLMGGESVPSAFTREDGVGTRRGGRITERPELRQQTDFKTGELLTWDDGSPRMQLVVTVQTNLRTLAEDDGRRRFYVKSDLQKKTRDKLREINAPGLEVGGDYYVTRIGQDAPRKKGEQGAWLHEVEYTPAAANFLKGDTQQPAAAATSTPAAAVTTPAALPYPAHMSPEQVAACQAAGLDPVQALAMFPAPAA